MPFPCAAFAPSPISATLGRVRSAAAMTILVLGALAAGPAACAANQAASAAIGTGAAIAAAGINRAVTGECWASCRPGTVCDKASGLCIESGGRLQRPALGAPVAASGAGANPPGHEYVVPPAGGAECACPPGEPCDAGPQECALDGGAPVSH